MDKVVLTDSEKEAIIKQYGALPWMNDEMNKMTFDMLPEELKEVKPEKAESEK